MTTFLFATLVFLIAMLGLGTGLLLAGRPLGGSCGGAGESGCAGCKNPCKKGGPE
jgi:hypothetical protein